MKRTRYALLIVTTIIGVVVLTMYWKNDQSVTNEDKLVNILIHKIKTGSYVGQKFDTQIAGFGELVDKQRMEKINALKDYDYAFYLGKITCH